MDGVDPLLGRVLEGGGVNPVPPRPGTPAPALAGLALLLGCQLAGELLARATGLPWPGPVLGLLLLIGLLAAGLWQGPIAAACEVLLAHLSLLFVPVGVGVIVHIGLVSQYGLRLLAVVVASTLLGMAAAALVLHRLWRRAAPPLPPSPGPAV